MDKLSDMSYNVYEEIMKNILNTGKYCDYADISQGMPFIVLRHDVEFSPVRAFKMHEIENMHGFRSSYFFQITNNTYNAFSKKNSEIIKEIHSNGHHIGLHYHLNGKTDLDEITADIKKQLSVMSEMLGIKIDRFSFHRPTNDVLKANIKIDSVINTYSPLFFSFAEKITDNTVLNVKYTSDSMFRWNYGFPCESMLSSFEKIQVLIHPCSWTREGYDNLNNFKSLIREKKDELTASIDSECRHFKEVRDVL